MTQTEGGPKDGAVEVQIILSNGVTYCSLLLQCRCPPRLISNYLSVRRKKKKKGVVVSDYLTTILLLQQTWIPVPVSVAIAALSEPTITNRSLYYTYTPHTHMQTKIFDSFLERHKHLHRDPSKIYLDPIKIFSASTIKLVVTRSSVYTSCPLSLSWYISCPSAAVQSG